MTKKQRIISKIIIGSVLICMLISPALAVDFTANILPDDLQISNPNPTGNFDIETTDAQELSATLNHIATTIWYIDGIESHTDHNSTTPDYYFTSSETGTINVTMVSTDSCFTQDTFTWFITVISTSQEPESVSVPYYERLGITPLPATIEQIEEEYFDDIEEYLGKIKIEVPDEIKETSETWKIILGLLIAGIILSGFLYYKINKDDERILPRKKQ